MNLGCQVIMGSVCCKPVLEIKGSLLSGPSALLVGMEGGRAHGHVCILV